MGPMTDDPAGDRPRSRNIKLTDADWDTLEWIAAHYGLYWAGIPSRSEAVRKLIEDEVARIEASKPS
jgi:hypothetical protein